MRGTTRHKNLGEAEETLRFELGRVDLVSVGDLTIGRNVLEPGWRWSDHIRPIVGGEWCLSRHVGVILSGQLTVVMEDGTRFDFGEGDVIDVAPGHDAWVTGDEPAVTIEWSGVRGWLEPLESLNDRVLATLVITDIVDSTALASRLGGSRWNDLLARHNERMRDALAQFRGREVKTTGDGVMAILDGAARAIRCAVRMGELAPEDGISIRAAVHTGEVGIVQGDVQGIAVHEAARVLAIAGPGEVLVTEVTRSLAGEAGTSFEDRGEHRLKGLDGSRRLFRVNVPPASG
ncbi:MAG TPA: adenylate/guanylate cyclase domain-containing protein [Actinomycetota bacterium]